MQKPWDAIVVGGGHNGLTCAAYLAKAGWNVLVLERRAKLGGAAVSEEVFPGFTYSVCSYVVSLLRPWIIRELDLASHGLEIIPLESAFCPYPDGRSLCRWSDPERTRREIAAFSKKDSEVYPQFGRLMSQLARFAQPLIDAPAPRPTSLNPFELIDLARHGKRFHELDGEKKAALLKLMTKSAVDLLDEWFECEQLKAPMSCSGIIGTFLGVRSPGTAYVLLHHYMGEIDGAFRAWGFAKGGTGAVSEAIAGSARAHGVSVRTRAGVQKILLEGESARGVVLEDGQEIRARHVISGLDPHNTFLRLLGEKHLPADFVASIRRFRMRGSSGKVNLAVDRVPSFTSRPGAGPHLRGDIAISPSIDYLERAYDEAKSGTFSSRPFLNIVIPSLVDPSVAPPGKHVVSCSCSTRPTRSRAGRNAGRSSARPSATQWSTRSRSTAPASRARSCTDRC